MSGDASGGDPTSSGAEAALLQPGGEGEGHSIGAGGLRVVRDETAAWALEDLLLGARENPVVVLTQSEETLQPVLSPQRLRALVGPRAEIFYVPGEYLLEQLRAGLGSPLAVYRGAARVFWPELWRGADPADHPLVPILEGELEGEALAELARQFDLTRPAVRHEIRLIDDARAFLQSELAATSSKLSRVAEQLRDANIQRHEALMRAERAEGHPPPRA